MALINCHNICLQNGRVDAKLRRVQNSEVATQLENDTNLKQR
jgi:hypothetical protein